jgi:hypothetical protein
MFEPTSPAALLAMTAMAVDTLFFIPGAMLPVSQALTTGLMTKTPATERQTAPYRAPLPLTETNMM